MPRFRRITPLGLPRPFGHRNDNTRRIKCDRGLFDLYKLVLCRGQADFFCVFDLVARVEFGVA